MRERWGALPPYPKRVLIRLACLPFLWLLATLGIFFLIYVAPDRDPARIIAGQGATEEQLERIRDDLNLGDPLVEQYIDWLTGMLRGDLGTTYRTDEPVADELERRLPASITLVAYTLLTVAAVSVAACWGATRFRAGLLATRWGAALFACVPLFLALALLIIIPSYLWNYAMPVGGYVPIYDDPWHNIRLLLLPAIVAGLIAAGWTVPAVVQSDRNRRTWDIRRVVLIASHSIVAALPLALSSMILIDVLLSIDGVGYWFYQSVFVADLPVVQTLAAVLALWALLGWVFAPPVHDSAENVRPTPFDRPLLITGAVLVVAFIAIALVGPLFLSDPRAFDITAQLERPSFDHPLGTTQLGQDILSRTAAGIRASLKVGFAAAVFGLLPGVLAAGLASRVRRIASLTTEAARLWLALPLLPLMLLFVPACGPGLRAVFTPVVVAAFMLGVSLAPQLSKIDLQTRAGQHRIIWMTLARAALVVAVAILAESTLSFLGLGVEQGDTSLGADIRYGSSRSSEYPYLLLGPGLFLCALILSFLLLRTSLDDEVPPRTYER